MTVTQMKFISDRFLSIFILLSMLVGIFVPSFFIAQAADTLYGPVGVTVDMTAEYISGVLDASGHENLVLSFDYVAESLDGAGGVPDSFTYGWRIGGSDTDLNTFTGISEPGVLLDETGAVSVGLPVGAQVANLEIYISVDANSTSPSDEVVISNLMVIGDALACAPQHDVVGPTAIQNTDTSDYFGSIQDAIADCDTNNGHIILLSGDVTTTEQITIDKEIILDGGNSTIIPTFAKTSNSNNSAIAVINTDAVTIKNLTIDGTGGTNLHGINTYESDAVSITNVTMNDINRTGIVVNGSAVSVTNLTTTGSGWHAINVAQGGGVITPSALTINNTSMHSEVWPSLPHIYIDDIAQSATVDDVEAQYDFVEFPNPGNATLTARAYYLKVVSSPTENEPLRCSIGVDGNTTVRENARVSLVWDTFGATQVSIDQGVVSTSTSDTEEVVVSSDTTYTLTASNNEEAIQCDVLVTTVSGNGDGGSSTPGGGSDSGPAQQVLGAATSTDEESAQCGMYLREYMQRGIINDSFEVTKLQIFLTTQGYFTPMTGSFGVLTDANVRLFQTAHVDDILKPWFDIGLTSSLNSTGYVYKTTRWKINDIVCPGSETYPILP